MTLVTNGKFNNLKISIISFCKFFHIFRYHWQCVGIFEEPQKDQDWNCSQCLAKQTPSNDHQAIQVNPVDQPIQENPTPMEDDSNNTYPCDSCDMVFPRPIKLKIHKNNLNNKIEQCEYCEFKSCTKIGLTSHVKFEHASNEEISSNEVKRQIPEYFKKSKYKVSSRPFACDKCDAAYKSSVNLMEHKKTSGYKEGQKYVCHKCQAEFCTRFMQNKHMNKMHSKDKLEVAKIEDSEDTIKEPPVG